MSEPRAWWRLLTIPILATTATGVGVYSAGAPISRAVLMALTIGTVSWLILGAMLAPPVSWPPRPEQIAEPGRAARGFEIPGFEVAMNRPEFLSRRVISTVRELAVVILARAGVDLDDPADADRARELLGDRTFRVLNDVDTGWVRRADLIASMDRVTLLATGEGFDGPSLRIDPRLLPHRRRRPVRATVFGAVERRKGRRTEQAAASDAAAAAGTRLHDLMNPSTEETR